MPPFAYLGGQNPGAAVPLCSHFPKAALRSGPERGRNAPRRRLRFPLTVFPLILVLLLIILSSAPIRPSNPDIAEPAGGEAAQSTTAGQGWGALMGTTARHCQALAVHP